jgi:hypothetical protein
MKWSIRFVLGLCLFTVNPSLAQKYSASDILAKARQASGGEAWDGVAQCDSAGNLSVAGQTGSLRYVENLRNGANVSYVSIPEVHVKQANGVDLFTAWHQDDEGDIQLSPSGNPWQVDDLYLTSHSYWKPKLGGALVNVLEPSVDQGAMYDRLQFSVPGGHGFTLWINHSTHLIERISNEQIRYLSDFRRIDGILLPFSQRTVDANGKESVVSFTKRTVASQINNSVFAIPFRQDYEMPTSGVVTVPAETGIVFEAMLNGKGPFKMFFDTGSINLISADVAKQLGLALQNGEKLEAGGSGVVETKLTTIQTLGIGDLMMHDQKFHVVDFPTGYIGTPVGAVGYELFRRLTVKVDYERGELSFFDAPKFRYTGDGVRVPMHLDGFTLEVDGSIDGVPGSFSLDTGNEVAFELSSEYVRRDNMIEKLGAHYHGYAGRGYGGPLPDSYFARIGTMSLGAAEVHGIVASLSTEKSPPGTKDGNVGRSILRQFNVTFDCMRGALYLEKNANWGKPVIFNRAGILFDPIGHGEKVMTVIPGSPAEASGLLVGDLITEIDGRPPKDDVEEPAFLQAPGTVLHLRVERGNDARNIDVSLRDIL